MDTTQSNSSSSTAATSSQRQQSPANNVVPAPPQGGQIPSTEPYLQNFTLIAEAAKKAQVAVMVRDFEDCSL